MARIPKLTFERLDSDEAAPLLKIHPKILQKPDCSGCEITGLRREKQEFSEAQVIFSQACIM